MTQTIPTIISQHTEEAALCWLWRDYGATQPHYRLSDLINVDDQLEAHLDGLRIAGDEGWANCVSELRWQAPGEFFVASVLAVESGDEKRIELVMNDALAQAELARSVTAALGWLALDEATSLIEQWADDSDSRRRAIAVAAAAIHRFDLGPRLVKALGDEDARVRARGLRCVGELGRLDLIGFVTAQLSSPSPACRAAAAFTRARLSDRSQPLDRTVEVALSESAVSNTRQSLRDLQVLMHRVTTSRAAELIRGWQSSSTTIRCGLTAAGLSGNTLFIPWLLEQFDVPEYARLAGESFTMITGLSIDTRPYEGEWPAGFEAGPNENSSDDNVALDPDENLPWPHRATITTWWHERSAQFQPDTRYLLGQPVAEDEWLEHVLRHGYQRQRSTAAIELSLRYSNQPLHEVRAPGRRQLM